MNRVFEYKGWHFEWDSNKEASNISKHQGIDFEQAAIFFRDGESVIDPDYKHSKTEERWVVTGPDDTGQFMVICVSWRETNAGMPCHRIISAHRISAKDVSKHRKRLGKR